MCVGVCCGGDVCVQMWCVCFVCVVCDMCGVCRGDVCVSSCLAPKALPRVRSKRSRVYLQNARVTKDTGVLNVQTRTFSTYTRERISLLFSRLSLFSRVSLSLLLVSLFSLSNNDNDHSSSRLSVYAQL